MKLVGGISFELERCAIAVFDDAEKLNTATDELDFAAASWPAPWEPRR